MSENLPKWVAEEIRDAKFGKPEKWEGSGYILDSNKEQRRIDVQFYEKLPEGRYIATLELPADFRTDSLQLGLIYLFKFNAYKASLSEKVTKFLKEEFNLKMDSIYRFELQSADRVEAESDNPPQTQAEGDE